MNYSVPFISQHVGIGDHQWKWRGCGVASLAMAMAYWHQKSAGNASEALDALIEKGLAIGAYREGVGWVHAGLVALAQHYGYRAEAFDYADKGKTPKTMAEAWELLAAALSKGPVLVSVFPGLNPERGGGHIVLVTGMDDQLVYFNDPEELTENDGKRLVALSVFEHGFKRRFITVTP
jgi:predicted double-glycine peptidase